MSFSPDGKRIVSGGGDHTLKIWDATTGEATLTIAAHLTKVLSVSFSPDGQRIVSGSMDNTLRVWDAPTGHETLTLKGYSDTGSRLSFSPNEKRIVSVDVDETVTVWDAETGRTTLTHKGDWSSVLGVSFSSDGKPIVIGTIKSKPRELTVWQFLDQPIQQRHSSRWLQNLLIASALVIAFLGYVVLVRRPQVRI